MKISSKWVRLIGATAVGLVAAVNTAFAADKVSLRLDWVYGSEHAPIFLAIEKGFFKDENIDLNLMPGEGSSVTVKLVGNRDADFGYATADQVLIGAQRGLPLVVVLQQNPTALIFKASAGIKDIKTDLKGKTIGVQLKSNTSRQWEAIKKSMALDTKSFIEVPADGALVPLLTSDRIQVGIGFYFNDGLKLKATGTDATWISFEDLGIKMYSTTLLTNAALIEKNPELVKRFTRAFMKGWSYSLKHPDEALQAFLKANPSTDKVYAELKLPEVLKLTYSADVKVNGLGHSTAADWENLQKQLIEMEIMKEKTDVLKVFSNNFLN